MAAGLGYKEFNTGDVLTAADANGYLASQVVMVFASAAARTSAIASPQEGMISYLKDTNSTEYYSGSAWVAIGGSTSGDYVLLNTYTMPGSASTYSVNSAFSSTYTNYVIVGKMNNSSTGSLNLKLRASGTDSSASYSSFIQYWGVNAADGTTKANNTTAGIYLENAGSSNWISLEILNPFDAAATGFIHSGIQQLGDGYGHFGSGFHNVATSYDGFTIIGGAGNLSGTFSLYGLKK